MENPQQAIQVPSPKKGTGPILAIGIAMITFVAGLVIGFVGRPAVVPDVVQVVTATPDATAVAQAAATPTASSQGTIMDVVLADARHSQGDINAPVTIVEFSDFK